MTMLSDSVKRLGRDLLRQIICDTLNRHKNGEQPMIVLVDSRRSGSTLIMQMIAQNAGIKPIDQPFSPFTVAIGHAWHLPKVTGGIYLGLDSNDKKQLETYVRGMISGEIHVNEPWRVWTSDFNVFTNRLVLKTTSAHFIEGFLCETFNPVVIRYLRHPVSQALSCYRNGWGDKLQFFRASRPFWEQWMTDQQRALFEEIASTREGIDRYVLSWCCENLPILQEPTRDVLTLYYETLVQSPENAAQDIARHCGLKETGPMVKMAKRRSRSVKGLSDPLVAKAIKDGQIDNLVSRWMSQVTTEEKSRYQKILDAFSVTQYTCDDPMPKIDSARK